MSLIKIIVLLLTFFLGALAHEGDIQAQCKKNGESGFSTWRGELICSPKIDT